MVRNLVYFNWLPSSFTLGFIQVEDGADSKYFTCLWDSCLAGHERCLSGYFDSLTSWRSNLIGSQLLNLGCCGIYFSWRLNRIGIQLRPQLKYNSDTTKTPSTGPESLLYRLPKGRLAILLVKIPYCLNFTLLLLLLLLLLFMLLLLLLLFLPISSVYCAFILLLLCSLKIIAPFLRCHLISHAIFALGVFSRIFYSKLGWFFFRVHDNTV